MLVYIHVPFCRTRCRYCAFYSSPLGRGVTAAASPAVRDYVDTLLMELALWGDRLGGSPVETVFFGGGTPSLLPPRIIGVVLERLAKYFKLAPKAEVTLEANPESLRGGHTAAQFLSAGVNRLSIGLQSMDETQLRLLGRAHKAADSLHSVFLAREAGCANINVDLMWGLPGQSVRHWLQTLKDVFRMTPDHISAYGLTLEPGTALEADVEEGRLSLPPERDQNIMFMEGAALLEQHGYLHYEISNFARMGFQCRHNLGYWEGADYLGLGPSATSTIQNRRWTNPAGQNAWNTRVRQGSLDAEAEILTPETRVLELLMLRLRTARGLRVKDYHELTGRDFTRDHQKLVQALHENGLIRLRDGYLRLTRKGMVVSNAILTNLFARTREVLHTPLPQGAAPQAVGTTQQTPEPDVRPVRWPSA
ncbi:radical SAM family heme chaperone HemW [Desulfovibrio legallii]|uniref:Heme chaperone HemW n=1 Tax=Desulfovibrio legallii TaxID=571438 RepID=A0A1G7NP38_9BACT|nr:radical SAM family heme chaperone HemW [Desulfovibrio legallii]SDF75711.1 coproporphyrinogen III oxidase, anaerobic [Desulfovibrio legallii]